MAARVEVECEELGEGCRYREVVRTPFGDEEMRLDVEALRDCEEFRIRCVNTGTFVDGRMGMKPNGLAYRVFDAVAGRIYFRRWLAESLDAIAIAARERTPTPTDAS